MTTSKDHQSPEAVAAQSAGAAAPVSDRRLLAARAEHLSWCVQFGLDQPETLQQVLGAANELRDAPDLSTAAERMLEHALTVTAADFGNVQILDRDSGALRIIAQSGFAEEFLEYFSVVDDTASVCGRAVQASAQMVVGDVVIDPGFAPHRDIAAASGFRGVQSTPLLDHTGQVVGMLSTHFRHPHQPPQGELALLALYGDFAGEIAARLVRPSVSESAGGTPGWAAAGRGLRRLRPIDVHTEITERLGAVELTLKAALDRSDDPVARDRIAWALGELDDVTEQVHQLCRSPEGAGEHERCNSAAFAELGDRLVRTLFDGGLQLHRARVALEGGRLTPAAAAAALEAVERAADDLDEMIRDTGMTMLALTSAVPLAELGKRRRRR
ncbi:GAF domain-containing protein [Nocardia sp. IFM 10818]